MTGNTHSSHEKSSQFVTPVSEVDSPFATRQQPNFHFSLSSLLLCMALFAAVSTSLVWASRVPGVMDDFYYLFGSQPSTNADGSDRGTQLIFLLICYSSPILLAASLRLVTLFFDWFGQWRQQNEIEDDEFSMESK